MLGRVAPDGGRRGALAVGGALRLLMRIVELRLDARVSITPAQGETVTLSAVGGELASLEGHHSEVTAIDFSADGLLVSADEASLVRVWNVPERRVIAELPGHNRRVSDVRFSPDGDLLASCGMDARLLVWEREPSDANGVVHTAQG